MKLKELLKHHNINWPSNATHAAQHSSGMITFLDCADRTVQTITCGQMASDWDIAIVAKQNWIQITREQIKSIPVGSPIRVGGVETVLTYHYRSPTDYGFDVGDELNLLNGYIFADLDWRKGIEVEVIMKESSHPHASLMLQYAQDAAKTTEPHLLWQYSSEGTGWTNFGGTPSWDANTLYRRKPVETFKLIHGVAVPDISFTPKEAEDYYLPLPTEHPSYIRSTYYSKFEVDQHRLKHNLCYPTTDEGREAAILHAKAMLGV